MNMNVRDLQEVIAENAKHQREKFDSLAQKYLQLCKEYLLEHSNNVDIYNSTFIGIPIKSVDIKFGEKLTIASAWFIDGDDSIDDYDNLESFESFNEYHDLYGEEIEYSEITPFVKALESVGFTVFVSSEDNNNILIPFFEKNI